MLRRYKVSEEPVVRILGSFVVDKGNVDNPAILAVGGSSHGRMSQEKLHVLYCHTQRFDARNAIYTDKPQRKEMTAAEILREGQTKDKSAMNLEPIESNSSFGLRWKPLPTTSSHSWSVSLAKPREILGKIEFISLTCLSPEAM